MHSKEKNESAKEASRKNREKSEGKETAAGEFSEEKKAEAVGEEVTLAKKDYNDLLGRLKELESNKDQLLRTAADFENAKKRLAREREEFVKFSQENLIRSLLPVLDNFERALAHADQEDAGNMTAVITGVERVWKQFQDILTNQGLKKLETVGKKFNPHFHETVGYVQEEGEEDIIVEEVEPGYQFHDRLLRAAKVRVRISPAPLSQEDSKKQDKDEIT